MNTSRLVLLGGGHAHIQVLKSLSMQPLSDAEIFLVSDHIFAPYSGMLPGRLAGWFSDEEIHFDLPLACGKSGVTFVHSEVSGIDLIHREILLKGRDPLSFDYLSVNVGIRPSRDINIVDGSFVTSLKPISELLRSWRNEKGSCAIIGGGAAGFEIACVLALNSQHSVTLIEKGVRILPAVSDSARAKAYMALRNLGVTVIEKCDVEKIDGRKVYLSTNGQALEKSEFDKIVLATPAEAPKWLATSELKLSQRGFLSVDKNLQSVSHKTVFGAGDCIDFTDSPLPKAGVYSVRQGPILTQNLRAAVMGGGEVFKPYRPQKRFLSLMVSGDHRALMSYGPFSAEGKWVWKWKESIDRKFMDRFQPHSWSGGMSSQMSGKMDINTCGGCGAKASRDLLGKVLPRLGVDSRFEDSVPFPGDSARVTTIDGFRSFTHDQNFFARVAMWHALNDLFSSGASPEQVNVFVCLCAEDSVSVRASQLREIMLGVNSVLNECGASLGNAHTAEGKEVSLVINAVGKTRSAAWPKCGARDGDVLVMTKRLGSGAALQSLMQGKLKAQDWSELSQHLLLSHLKVGEALRGITVNACTDISGFGLLGHLSEMLEGSRLGLRLRGAVLPILNCFKFSVQSGVSAFLAGENRVSYAKYLLNQGALVEPLWNLLFDPQTHGPLALAIPAAEAATAIAALQRVGYLDAVVVGEFQTRSGSEFRGLIEILE